MIFKNFIEGIFNIYSENSYGEPHSRFTNLKYFYKAHESSSEYSEVYLTPQFKMVSLLTQNLKTISLEIPLFSFPWAAE